MKYNDTWQTKIKLDYLKLLLEWSGLSLLINKIQLKPIIVELIAVNVSLFVRQSFHKCLMDEDILRQLFNKIDPLQTNSAKMSQYVNMLLVLGHF